METWLQIFKDQTVMGLFNKMQYTPQEKNKLRQGS